MRLCLSECKINKQTNKNEYERKTKINRWNLKKQKQKKTNMNK